MVCTVPSRCRAEGCYTGAPRGRTHHHVALVCCFDDVCVAQQSMSIDGCGRSAVHEPIDHGFHRAASRILAARMNYQFTILVPWGGNEVARRLHGGEP